MKKILLAASATMFLTGCASTGGELPVGWGGTFSVVASNPVSITLKYDPWLSSYGKVQQYATEHCLQYGKYPLEFREGGGAVRWVTFKCVKE